MSQMEPTLQSASRPLSGRVALVTGSSSGIGQAVAHELARRGARVAITSRTLERAQPVADEIASTGGAASAYAADLAQPAEAERLVGAVADGEGRLDILVNNAGVYEFSPLEGVSEQSFHKHFDTNVLGLILASKEAAKYFGPEGGSIINISSVVSSITPPNTSIYAATKGAVDAATRTLAKELGPRKIRVNAINPGMVLTEGALTAGFDKGDFRQQIEAQTPLGRIGQVDDIAPAAVFFASTDSAWITGETLRIAGGLR